MSAPRTNIEEQGRRHITPLVGIVLVVVFVAVLYAGWSLLVAARGETPGEPAAQVDGRTGQIEQTAPAPTAPAATTETTPVPGAAPQADPTD